MNQPHGTSAQPSPSHRADPEIVEMFSELSPAAAQEMADVVERIAENRARRLAARALLKILHALENTQPGPILIRLLAPGGESLKAAARRLHCSPKGLRVAQEKFRRLLNAAGPLPPGDIFCE